MTPENTIHTGQSEEQCLMSVMHNLAMCGSLFVHTPDMSLDILQSNGLLSLDYKAFEGYNHPPNHL